MANLTFQEITNRVLAHAFNEGDRENAKQWVCDYYRRTWDLIDWPFKIPDLAELLVVGDDPTPAMPADLSRVIEILDDNQVPLGQISQETFDDYGYSDPDSTGRPSSYWMNGRQAVLGPVPASDYTFQIRYERGVTHRDSGGNYVAGPPVEDDDTLFWDGYEWLVIFGARAIGKPWSNNPTSPEDQNQADAMLLDMISAWFPSGGAPQSYGRDRLGAY